MKTAIRGTENAVDQLLTALRLRREPPAAVVLKLRTLADKIETALGRAGMLTIHETTTWTGGPTMDDLESLIDQWERSAEHYERNPSQRTAAEAYEVCAAQLRVRLNALKLQQRKEAVGA